MGIESITNCKSDVLSAAHKLNDFDLRTFVDDRLRPKTAFHDRAVVLNRQPVGREVEDLNQPRKCCADRYFAPVSVQ